MDRPSRWVYLLPLLHLCACLTSYVGLLEPSLQHLGILFTFVQLADLPISLPAYFLGWKYSTLAVIWIFVAGNPWSDPPTPRAPPLLAGVRCRKSPAIPSTPHTHPPKPLLPTPPQP